MTLTYSSQNATSCTLTSLPSIWTTATEPVSCNGTYADDVGSSTTAQEWTFTFTASNANNPSAASSQTLVQSAPAVPSPEFDNPSPNWSGYVVPSSSNLVTNVEGEWIVPTMNCVDTPNGGDSIWVGLGGEQWNATSSSGALLQTGVSVDCTNGVQQNSAWWEVVPATPNHEEAFTDFPITAGDEIQASVLQLSDGEWETIVSNLNTGLSALMVTGEAWGVGPTESGTITFSSQGNAVGYSYSGGYTAEWIVEDPEESSATPGNPLYPFANFDSVSFTNMRSSFTSWSLTPSEEWGIVQSGVTLAAPTSTSTDGFTDTYVGP